MLKLLSCQPSSVQSTKHRAKQENHFLIQQKPKSRNQNADSIIFPGVSQQPTDQKAIILIQKEYGNINTKKFNNSCITLGV